MQLYKRAILPIGFKANGLACGIKRSGKLDLALFYSDLPAKTACQFTINKIQAAPVIVSKKQLSRNRAYQAIIVNSGNANCFTGLKGIQDAEDTIKALAKSLSVERKNILVSSTGIIGKKLPLLKIKKAFPELIKGLSKQGIDRAKKAIMTTDTFTKEITVKSRIAGSEVTICGIAKGAGMIAPQMSGKLSATMLAFIFTDANISQRALNKALGICTEESFNSISIDGCMSTNDTVGLMANGLAKNRLIDINLNFDNFLGALRVVCLELAKLIVKDAEGASKFIRIEVTGARDFKEAKRGALAIANSNLFKTAIYGENPNFGRIAAALGASGIELKEKNLKIKVSPLNKKEVNVLVNINRGKAKAIAYTADLTPEYIKINAAYN